MNEVKDFPKAGFHDFDFATYAELVRTLCRNKGYMLPISPVIIQCCWDDNQYPADAAEEILRIVHNKQ
jgi:hypothetical protein